MNLYLDLLLLIAVSVSMIIKIETYLIVVSYPVRSEELAVVEALKVRAVPEGSDEHLLEFLKVYRDAVQIIVNEL